MCPSHVCPCRVCTHVQHANTHRIPTLDPQLSILIQITRISLASMAAARPITAALLLTTACLVNALGSCDAKMADCVAKKRCAQWHQHRSTTQSEKVRRSLLQQDTAAAPAAAPAAGPPLQLPKNALKVSNNKLEERSRDDPQLCGAFCYASSAHDSSPCHVSACVCLPACIRWQACMLARLLTILPLAMRGVIPLFSRWFGFADANLATCRPQTCTLDKQKDATRCKAVKQVYYEQKDAGAHFLSSLLIVQLGAYQSNHP